MKNARQWIAVGAMVVLGAALAVGGCDDDDEGAVPAGGSAGTDSGGSSAGGAAGGGGAAGAGGAPQNAPPTASFVATPEAGPAELEVDFDASDSSDADGTIVDYAWDFGDGSTAAGVTASHGFATVGCYAVALTVTDDDGDTDTAEQTIVVTEGTPSGEPVVTFTDLPAPMALVPRDLDTDLGAVRVRGTVSSPGYHAVVVEVSQSGTVVDVVQAPLCSTAEDDPFDVYASIPAELENHDVSVYLASGDDLTLVAEVAEVVAGDVYLVQGQSNAVAAQYSGDANVNQGPFLRSFGTRNEDGGATAADLNWYQAEGNLTQGSGAVGQWSLRMGRMLVDEHEVPVAILNGARGGRPISYFQRNDNDTEDLTTNYGRLLMRARAADVDGAVRAILYYQGESDGSNATGHHDGWIALHEDWMEDFPAVEQIYVTQVRTGCGSPSPALREVQRSFADELDNVSVMSTTGLDGHDACHFAYANGYEQLGERYAALLGRDLYGAPALPDIEAPNIESIAFSNAEDTEITIELRDADATMSWDAGSQLYFAVEGAVALVLSGEANGATLVLSLSASATGATGLTYLGHTGSGPWITNATDVGLLAFHNLPIEAF